MDIEKKDYLDVMQDDWGIFWQNKRGRLRFAWKPKIILKEFMNIMEEEWKTSQQSLDDAKEIFKFFLTACKNVQIKGLSVFVWYPNRKYLNDLTNNQNVEKTNQSDQNNEWSE